MACNFLIRLLRILVSALALQGMMSAQSGSSRPAEQLPEAPTPRLEMQGDQSTSISAALHAMAPSSEQISVVSLEGKHAMLSMVSEVSSKLPSGSGFQARLEREVAVDGQTILPKGTLLEGHLQTIHARRLMRPGSLFMAFERAVFPNGMVEPVNVSLVSTESPAARSDAEGMLHPTLSKKRMLIQFGGAGLTAKFADDLAQVIAGSALSAASARYVGMAAAGTFLAIEKGREVKLKPGDQLEVEFGRIGANPVSR